MSKYVDDLGATIFAVGMIPLVIFMLIYIFPLLIYIDININRDNLSTWQSVACGEYNIQRDSYGRQSLYIGDRDIKDIEYNAWKVVTDKDNQRVVIADLLEGHSYCIYEKSFWWPAPKYYVVEAYENTTNSINP